MAEEKHQMREMSFEFEEGVKLLVDRVPGTKGFDLQMMATTTDAAVKGICLLICKVAELLNCSVEEVICRVTAKLLAPELDGGYPNGC